MTQTQIIDHETKNALVPAPSIFGEAVVVDDSPLWMAWEGARQSWLNSKRRKSGGENTVNTYQVAFKQFFEFCALPPWQVSSAAAQKWAEQLDTDGLSQSTIGVKLAALSSFYAFVQKRYTFISPDGRELVLWAADRRNPFDAVERPQVSAYERATFPDSDEIGQILAAINRECLTGKRDFALLYTILVTCRRCSEVLDLKWGDLQPLDDGHHAFTYRYKGGKTKKAVLNRLCYAAIVDYLRADARPPESLAPDDYIFVPIDPTVVARLPGRDLDDVEPNQPISNSMANKILKKYARRAGVDLEKAHIHALRHAGARLRVKQAKDAGRSPDYAELMDLLGHSSLAVTQIYSTTVLEDPEDPGGDAAAQALFPRSKRRKKAADPPAQQGKLL